MSVLPFRQTNSAFVLFFEKAVEIEQELTEGSFSGFEALTITGVQQHSLYNIFSSTTLPNNDPFSSDVFYNVTITSGYPEYGTVSGDTSVQRKQGETVTFTANPITQQGGTEITKFPFATE